MAAKHRPSPWVRSNHKPLSFGKQGPEFTFNRTTERGTSVKGDSTLSRWDAPMPPVVGDVSQAGPPCSGRLSQQTCGRNEATRRYGLLLAGVTQRLVSAAQSDRFRKDLRSVLAEAFQLRFFRNLPVSFPSPAGFLTGRWRSVSGGRNRHNSELRFANAHSARAFLPSRRWTPSGFAPGRRGRVGRGGPAQRASALRVEHQKARRL